VVVSAQAEANPLERPLDELLRRRMLITYLGILSAIYSLAVFQALVLDHPRSDTRGEVIAVVVTFVGLLLSLRKPLAGWRYPAILLCIGAAPIAAVLFHNQLIAQI